MWKKASFVSCVVLCLSVMVRADMVAYWPLDEGAGTSVGDRTGLWNGAITGDLAWVEGVVGTALEFPGGANYVDFGNVQIGSSMTLVYWCFNPAKAYERPIGQHSGDYTTDPGWVVLSRNEGEGGVWFRVHGADNAWNGGDIVIEDNLPKTEWYHLAFTFDGVSRELKGYLNSELKASAICEAGRTIEGNKNDLRLGNVGTGEVFTGMLDDIAIWDTALTDEEVLDVFLLGPEVIDPRQAGNPSPEDEATDVPLDTILSWTSGMHAETHDVYFGTGFNDVNDASRADGMGVLVSQGQTATSYDTDGSLDFEQTYFWRVDEVNAAPDNTIFKGKVWSFTVEPLAYPIENIIATSNGTPQVDAGPENVVNGSGLNADNQHSTASPDMWLASPVGDEPLYILFEFDRVYKLHQMLVWNYNVQFELILGFGLKSVTVEYSENGTDWAALGDVEFARATATATYTANTAVDFGGVPAKYVRLNVNTGWGMMGQFGLSEVRFMYIPAQAREPQPANGAADVEVGTALSWRPGREAVSHEVYLGTAPDAMTLTGTVSSATFAPGNLEFGRTYYWQIVEVNEADTVTEWSSNLWSFSTQEYASIDGFETYNDDIEAGTAIFDTWLDGWVNDTGSTVGYFDAPFAEQTIVRSGKQSMPLQYDNTVSPFYSEAEREFETAQDWTGNGADRLVLYVQGQAPAFVEMTDGSILMNAIGTDIWDVSDQFRYAYKNLSGNGSMVVRVDSLVRSNEWAKAGVMIRETLEPGSKHAFVAVTPEPIHGISFQRRLVAGQASANTDVADITIPHWVKLTRTGNTFTAQQSADGATWTDIVVSPALEIQMASNVYIGLALTSHDAAIVTAAEFSNVSTTGNVTGAWQTAEIGVAQPTGNSAESIYVAIEDGTGKTKTVVNADAAITVWPSWQQWSIPYSDLSGVNLSRVQKMTIGVGSKSSPSAGGTGIVYVDDIGFGRPAATE